MLAELDGLERVVKEKGAAESSLQRGKMEELDTLMDGQGKVEARIRILGKFSS